MGSAQNLEKRDSGLSLTGPGTQPYAHPELYSDVVWTR